MSSSITEIDLESFILDSDLESLEKKVGKFNLFSTLNVSDNEMVHSSTS